MDRPSRPSPPGCDQLVTNKDYDRNRCKNQRIFGYCLAALPFAQLDESRGDLSIGWLSSFGISRESDSDHYERKFSIALAQARAKTLPTAPDSDWCTGSILDREN